MKRFQSHGDGEVDRALFASAGANVVFERGAMVFHAENIELGDNVYVGHYAILKGYHRNRMVIGDDVWIGQQAFLHSAGGLFVGNRVGIAPAVRIITSRHQDPGRATAIMEGVLEFAPVTVGDGCDIGTGAIILPGVTIGRGVQVAAGAVVTKDIPEYTVVAGVPARVIRARPESSL